MSRRAAREASLMVLFQVDVGNMPADKAIRFALELDGSSKEATAGTLTPDDLVFFETLVSGVLSQRTEVDAIISRYAVGWHIDRMGSVDRNILRMSIYEFALANPRVPISVALNEAVELAKVYGDDESSRFINGVLANVVKGLQLLGNL